MKRLLLLAPLVIGGCAPKTPTVTPEQMSESKPPITSSEEPIESPSPEPSATPANEPTPGDPSEVVGTYKCTTLMQKAANDLTMNEEGSYQFGDAIRGTYSRLSDTKIQWTGGEIMNSYKPTAVLVFYAKPVSITLDSLGTNRALDLVCKRNE